MINNIERMKEKAQIFEIYIKSAIDSFVNRIIECISKIFLKRNVIWQNYEPFCRKTMKQFLSIEVKFSSENISHLISFILTSKPSDGHKYNHKNELIYKPLLRFVVR